MKPGPADYRPVRLLCLLLAMATLLTYCRVGEFSFTNFDDPEYVTDNSRVAQGLTLKGSGWALTTTEAGNWHPVTWLSHMLDVELFGMVAGWHHLTNLLLHTANTVLLFLVFWRMTGAVWRPAFVAALFALHPLHVESVAWIAERKDVLSTLFGLACLWCYARYAQALQPSARRGESRSPGKSRPTSHYLLALAWFALSLMSKPMLVTLPAVLLLLDYWPLERGRERGAWVRLLVEKVPFMLLSLLSCVVTFVAQQKGGAVASVTDLPVVLRVESALVAYAEYLVKLLIPTDLAAFYPHPGRWPAGQVIGAACSLAALTGLAIWLRGRKPWLVVGWAWYLVTLLPVVGLVQVGMQSHADRYSYLTLTGAFIILAWSTNDLLSRWEYRRRFLAFAAAIVLLGCGALAHCQLEYWRDSESLFGHAIAVTANNYAAYNNRGVTRFEQGKTNEALADFLEAVRLKPDSASALTSIGMAMGARGHTNEAIGYYRAALQADPRFAQAHYDLGLIEFAAGNQTQALHHFEAAMASRPDFPDAQYNLATTLESLSRFDKAVFHYQRALELRPEDPDTLNNLGVALARQGKLDDALRQFERALRLRPRFAQAHYNLAETLLQQGRFGEAGLEYRLALRYLPDWTEGLNNVAWLMATHPQPAMRNGPEALQLARKACQLRGPDVSYLQTLAAAYAECGRFNEASNTAQQAFDLAVATGQTVWTNTARQRLELYAAGKPLRQP